MAMRIPSIERGARLRDRALYAMVKTIARQRIPDVVRTLRFRPALFGAPMSALFQQVMRGPSEWSVGERELFAAWVSKKNECEF